MRRRCPRATPAIVGAVAGILAVALAGCAGRGQAAPTPRDEPTSSNASPSVGSPSPAPSTTVGQRPPTGFVPAAASFPTGDVGFAWGVFPCPTDSNAFCPGLAATHDAGATWKLRAAPAGTPIDPYHRAILRFADSTDGWAALGGTLYATHDGSLSWHAVTLPGVGSGQDVLAVEAGADRAYVLAGSSDNTIRLFTSSAALDDFQPIEDVSLPAAGATVHLSVADDGSGYVTADSVVGANPVLYATQDGTRWVAHASPCGSGARTAVAAGRGGNVTVICDVHPSRTGASKQLWTSVNGGVTFAAQEGPAAIGFTADVATPPLPPTTPLPGTSTTPPPVPSYVVAASALEDRIYLSLNGGRSWSVAYANSSDGSGSALGFADLHFSDPTHGMAILGNAGVFAKDRLAGSRAVLLPRLLTTIDGGRHWAQTVIQ